MHVAYAYTYWENCQKLKIGSSSVDPEDAAALVPWGGAFVSRGGAFVSLSLNS